MIPGKENTGKSTSSQTEKVGSFAFFDVEHFIRRLLRNWYWFALMAALGYAISWYTVSIMRRGFMRQTYH